MVCWLVGWAVYFRKPQLVHEPALSSLPSGLIPKDYRSLKTQYLQVRPGECLLEGTWWREVTGHIFERGRRGHGPFPIPVPIPFPSGLPLRGCRDSRHSGPLATACFSHSRFSQWVHQVLSSPSGTLPHCRPLCGINKLPSRSFSRLLSSVKPPHHPSINCFL